MMEQENSRRDDPQRVQLWEVVALGVTAAAIVWSCVDDSSRRLFWLDEFFTALLVSDASFGHMLAALKSDINAVPPFYFVAGWAWGRLFGVSELSLRLPSALLSAVAIVAIWWGLRRLVRPWLAVVCAITLPFLCWPFRYNIAEARCYALYLAAYAWSTSLYLRCDAGNGRAGRAGYYISVTVAHGLLVATHYVGGLYSATLVASALLCAILGRDAVFRRHAYFAAAGWLAIIPSWPFLMFHTSMVVKEGWIERPALVDLLEQYSGNLYGFGLIATLLLLAWVAADATSSPVPPADGPAALKVAALMAVTIVFIPIVWLESRFAARIFIARYLFLNFVVWCVMVAWSIERLWTRLWYFAGTTAGDGLSVRGRSLAWLGRSALLVLLGVFVAGAVTSLGWRRNSLQSDTLKGDLAVARELAGLPILTDNMYDFVGLAYYLRPSQRVSMLRETSGVEAAGGVGEALQRFYFPGSQTDAAEFMARHDRFLAIGERGSTLASLPGAADGAAGGIPTTPGQLRGGLEAEPGQPRQPVVQARAWHATRLSNRVTLFQRRR